MPKEKTPIKKYEWIVCVIRSDGSRDTTKYSAHHGQPVTAEHVRRSPSVCDWIAGSRLVSICPANADVRRDDGKGLTP